MHALLKNWQKTGTKARDLRTQAERLGSSELWDADWYRARYPDVGISGMDPAVHYLKYGAFMKRDPGPDFSTSFYCDIHPIVERQGLNPLLHHLNALRTTGKPAGPAGRNVIWAAARLAIRNPALALAQAERLAPPEVAPALEVLRANAALADEAAWVRHLNRYLAHFGMAPVQLSPLGSIYFDRLECAPLPLVETGPVVSVIMPAWNAEETLEQAARSILAQTWRPIELIIVDDASTDGTWAVMQSLADGDDRVRLLRNRRNVGPYVSKNIALTQARGEYVTGHDADDWAHPQRIERHIHFQRADGRRLRASDAYMLRMSPEGAFGKFAAASDLTLDGAARRAMISCLFETRVLREQVGYWQNIRFGADTEMIARTALVLGDEFAHAPVLSMICLDAESSLTNHPEHGIWSPEGGMPPIRKDFKNGWTQWHQSLTPTSAYLPFDVRPFPVGAAMLNNAEDIEALLEGYADTGTPLDFRPSLECDVCLVTDLRLSGGNASSTLDEVKFLEAQGLGVALIDVPRKTPASKSISERYLPWLGRVRDAAHFGHIRCRTLIVRHPSVACSDGFAAIRDRISADSVSIIVNNSVRRENGDPVYDVSGLISAAEAISCRSLRICPIGPGVRSELLDPAFSGRTSPHLSAEDWHPTFDLEEYKAEPKATFASPPRIGRHARDAEEKWLESREELLEVYPATPDVRVRILGGAAGAERIIGWIPDNWEVLEFGEVAPKEFLVELDVFVYFPHSRRNEAFGRTIAEAMIAGVPCILPSSFRTTFGPLAFYCGPSEVRSLVARLAEDDACRVGLLLQIQRDAIAAFASEALARRFTELGLDAGGSGRGEQMPWPDDLTAFRTYVETGARA